MNALIVDDEPLARMHLRRLLEAQSVNVVGEAGDSSAAFERAEDLRPDLLFLDIKMPGLSGLEMASALLQLDTPPVLIFVTGFREYAVAAFEHDAVDYLLKPVSPERLARTLARARARLEGRRTRQRTEADVRAAAAAAAAVPAAIRRLPVRVDYAVLLLRLENIRYAEARDKRVYVRTHDGAEHRTYYSLTQLESLMPHDQFLRVHESYVVRLDDVEELIFLGNHCYEIRMAGDQRLPVGRTRYPELRKRLGLDLVGPAEG